MKIIVAPDSFKGNLSASRVCAALERGLLRAIPDCRVIKLPLADGGEGTAKALTEAAGGRLVGASVQGPLGGAVQAEFGLINGGKTAVLDFASASGLELAGGVLDPLKASSCGAGMLLSAALDTGAREIIFGIGGSATNDGGMGMLDALGFKILDAKGAALPPGVEYFEKAARFDASHSDPRLRETSIRVACDVTNPLLGPRGASAVFGPQKGADAEMVAFLDKALSRLGQCWLDAGLAQDLEHPGDGAAGGAGAALRICLGARIESGALLVMKYSGFFEHLSGAADGIKPDLVITGEGMTDSQTSSGKLCSVVAEESHKAGVPVALVSGALRAGGDLSSLFELFDYAVSSSVGESSLDEMLKSSERDLSFAAENLARAIRLTRGIVCHG